ncbi:DNA processing protein [Leucobacter exalbidus]|uniref:DNA processing protein n=1 Tax=Leucobacter exalbidus TaxID=662960 RepID=A0A940PUE9_9MICO|nr:DNA-processing protein DprA [Leucobacter exalbidus]MBP1326405.1 DNA processing protein [Leucobacter exalbidus]
MPALTALARDDRSARLLLSIIGTPADVATGKLLTEVGAAELISIAEGDGTVPGMDRVEAAVWRDRLHSAATPDRLAERIVEASKFRVIIPSDPDWPTTLNDLGHRAPYALWAKGRTELLAEPLPQRITVTGARAATSYGAHVTDELCGDLAQSGRTLIAGAAYGIEASAHRAALLRDMNTIAVLASGVDRPYPAGHADLIDRIAREGLLLSEVPPSVAPTRQRFIDRSRILAALSSATIIVEAGSRSGSLHTATEAAQLGRLVGAVPGPVTSAASTGTNLMLQSGQASVITNGSDIMRMVEGETNAPERSVIRSGAPHVASPKSRVL